MITSGRRISMDAAISTGHLEAYCPCRCTSPRVSGAMLLRWIINSGHRKSFHTFTQVSTARTMTAGLVCGSSTRQYTCHGEQPSSMAASSRSAGRVRKNCRIRYVPNAVPNSPGTIIANGVPVHPNARIRRNCGITVTVSGTINVARYRTNNVSRPRNRSRANEYPASEQKKTWPAVTHPAYSTVFRNIRQNGISENTSPLLAQCGCDGTKVGVATSASVFNDPDTPHIIGNSAHHAPPISAAYSATPRTMLRLPPRIKYD